MITVFHANKDLSRDSLFFGIGETFSKKDALFNFVDGNYDKVGTVDGNDPDEAYVLTQNITHHWSMNGASHITPGLARARSTSVGDILDVDGIMYIVAPIGCKKL
jgi:hypothetical protein